MTRKTFLHTMSVLTMSAFATITIATSAIAPAAPGGGGGGSGGGGGGGGGGETDPNNLSVPAILIGGSPTLNFPCSLTSTAPTGTPLTGYPLDPTAYYYVQGDAKWQSSCTTDTTATATGAWGDNLAGDAKLKVGQPIRVEMGILATDPTSFNMTGWDVVKLEPAALDRASAYGTLATGSVDTSFTSNPVTPFPEVRVYDGDAWLTIYNKATGVAVVDGPASAEINSTGRIVYGYNLRVTALGIYVIEYTMPNVTITGADAGTINGSTMSLEINVVAGGGGGGGKK